MKRIIFVTASLVLVVGVFAWVVYQSTLMENKVHSDRGNKPQPVLDSHASTAGRATTPLRVRNIESTKMDRDLEARRKANSVALEQIDARLAGGLGNDEQEKALLERGRALQVLGRYDEALGVYSALIDSTTNSTILKSALPKYFTVAKDSGKLDSEMGIKETKLSDNPDDYRLMEILAYLYHYEKAYDEEIELRERLSQNGLDSENLNKLLDLYDTKTDYVKMADVYRRLAEVTPDNVSVYLIEKAKLELKAGAIASVKSTCDTILSMNDLSITLKGTTASLLGSIGEYEQALVILYECGKEAQTVDEREKCQLEIYRIEIRMADRSQKAEEGLFDLAATGQTRGVRRGAEEILKNIEN